MTDRTQSVDLGILLALAYQSFVAQLREVHAAAGFDDLGRSDGFVFRALATAPLTVSDLATRLGISKQGAGQIVDDMQRRGYVERRPDPADGRARLLYLSARGQAALAAARRFHHRYEQRLVRTHGPAAVDALRQLLEAMAGGAEQTIDPRLRVLHL
ncbi:MAG TPA: helix-turn-helix domain-containing protein [Catenuloplanes sp.]|jgi:DNA-binding MarR family transcriptional regulator